ncbi:uncharacterized protein [Littorina saxatilis]|uniref:uncharacterized protein n=1 Tax=Littorina saxatilis TaxID=31220 RepID=UPI0038B4B9FB
MKPVTKLLSWMKEFANDHDCIDTHRSDFFYTKSELFRMVALCGGLTLLVFTACCINTYSAPITCDARVYLEGQPALITCNFRTNISASQQSFNMARYPSTARQGEIGTDVLVCHWSDANHEHDCSVTYGYEFDNVITDQVTVTISEATESYEGLYMCFFVPSQGKDTHACDFKITLEPMVDVKTVNDNQTALPPNGGKHRTFSSKAMPPIRNPAVILNCTRVNQTSNMSEGYLAPNMREDSKF